MKAIDFLRCCALAVSIFGMGQVGFAQDIHFSQFANSPLTVNPGLAGIFGGDVRFVANVRDQWRNVRVPYSTFSGSVEHKFYHQKQQYNKYFTGGLLFNYDRQGALKLTTLRLGLPVSYTTPLALKHYLSVGIMPVFGQRTFSIDGVTTDSQWNGTSFDPGAPLLESELPSNTRMNYLDLNAGLNYRFQGIEKRTKLDAGVAFHHFNRPGFDFWETGDDIRLNMRTAVYLLGTVEVIDELDVVGQVVYQRQGGYEQTLWGIGGRLHLCRESYKEFAVQAGVNYRSRYNDAIIPHFEAHWRTWVLGFSYDINISQFKVATERRGGPELSLIYRLYRVKPAAFKSCPII